MCKHSDEVINKLDLGKPSTSIFLNLIDLVFNSQARQKISRGFFDFYRESLAEAVEQGYQSGSGASVQFGQEDHLMKAVLKANTVKYSAAKSVAMNEELNKLARTHSDFNEFKKAASVLDTKYNVNHLKTEYNLAYATAQNSAQYQRMLKTAEYLPYAVYRTVGDGRTRSSHAALNGTVVKVGSKEHQLIMPVKDYGCRCFMEPTDSPEQEPINESTARKLIRQNVSKDFQKPGASQGNIFD